MCLLTQYVQSYFLFYIKLLVNHSGLRNLRMETTFTESLSYLSMKAYQFLQVKWRIHRTGLLFPLMEDRSYRKPAPNTGHLLHSVKCISKYPRPQVQPTSDALLAYLQRIRAQMCSTKQSIEYSYKRISSSKIR